MTMMKPIKDHKWIAKLRVEIHAQHDDDEILDYLMYPNINWCSDHGYPDEEFIYWRNPEWTPENPNRFPEGVAEYTVRYSSKEAMDADVEARKWFLEGLPDGFAEWHTASAFQLTSSGMADLLQEQADSYHYEKMRGNPQLVVDNA